MWTSPVYILHITSILTNTQIFLKIIKIHTNDRCLTFTKLSLPNSLLESITAMQRVMRHHLCTYQCNSCGGGGVRARGGDLMPETIPMSGFWSCKVTPGSGHLTLTDRSLVFLVSIQKPLPSPFLEALSERHAVRERDEVFICFNRHNLILLIVI